MKAFTFKLKNFIFILKSVLFLSGLFLLFHIVFEMDIIATIFSTFGVLIILAHLFASPETKKNARGAKGGEKCLPWM